MSTCIVLVRKLSEIIEDFKKLQLQKEINFIEKNEKLAAMLRVMNELQLEAGFGEPDEALLHVIQKEMSEANQLIAKFSGNASNNLH